MATFKNWLSSRSSTDSDKEKKIKKIILYSGILLILISLGLLFYSLYISITTELDYAVNIPKVEDIEVVINDANETEVKENIVFLNPEFGISIPKIGANANVVANVDPFRPNEYNKALLDGVAHAKGTAFPHQEGNMFLFAHSAVNFYESRKYNVYFYLLNKLSNGDLVYISYKNIMYKYEVMDVKIVDKTEVQYLSKIADYNTLTLMTCYPAGLNISRIVVIAKQLPN